MVKLLKPCRVGKLVLVLDIGSTKTPHYFCGTVYVIVLVRSFSLVKQSLYLHVHISLVASEANHSTEF